MVAWFCGFKCASGHQILFSGDVFSFPSFILLPGETLVSLVAHRAGDLKKLLVQPRRVEGGETGLACVGRWDWTLADTTAWALSLLPVCGHWKCGRSVIWLCLLEERRPTRSLLPAPLFHFHSICLWERSSLLCLLESSLRTKTHT